MEKPLTGRVFFALFPAGSPASSGEQAVHINSLSVGQTEL
jgi:hypothetical protein